MLLPKKGYLITPPSYLEDAPPINTLPETNIAPENQWLEDEFPFGTAHFQGQAVSFRECIIEVVFGYDMVTKHSQPPSADEGVERLMNGGHVSNEKKPCCLGCIGDEKLPSCIGIIVNDYKDPY